MTGILAARRNPALPILFVGGPILLAGGLIAALILRLAIVQYPGGAMPTLPVGAYTGYSMSAIRPARADNALLVVFLCVAAVGLLALAVAVVLRARNWAAVLVVSGALLAIGGSIGGLAAKRSAEIVSFVASQPKSLVPDSLSNSLGLVFDPSSARSTPPDYTEFWLGMGLAAVGLLVVVTGVVVGVATRRLATVATPARRGPHA